jgi:hypothetical protein
MQTYRLYIDGEWVDTGTRYEVRNPANGEVIAECAVAGEAETERRRRRRRTRLPRLGSPFLRRARRTAPRRRAGHQGTLRGVRPRRNARDRTLPARNDWHTTSPPQSPCSNTSRASPPPHSARPSPFQACTSTTRGASPYGRRRRDYPVELPAVAGSHQNRPRAGSRQTRWFLKPAPHHADYRADAGGGDAPRGHALQACSMC